MTGTLQDRKGLASGSWLKPFEHRSAIDASVDNYQLLDSVGDSLVLLGILRTTNRTLDDFLKHPSAAVWLISENL
jgi:hypothetical protein